MAKRYRLVFVLESPIIDTQEEAENLAGEITERVQTYHLYPEERFVMEEVKKVDDSQALTEDSVIREDEVAARGAEKVVPLRSVK